MDLLLCVGAKRFDESFGFEAVASELSSGAFYHGGDEVLAQCWS